MPRTPDFEDRPFNRDWPEDVKALYRAAQLVGGAGGEIEDIMGRSEDATLGPLYALAGDTYKLLVAYRAEGEKRLAAWEAAAQTPRIVTVVIFRNGVCAAFDADDDQIPAYQGMWSEKRQAIADAGYRGFVEFADERMRYPEWLTFNVENS